MLTRRESLLGSVLVAAAVATIGSWMENEFQTLI